ncbi:unnamed protein product [Ectocarpus fasciculatus]
MSVRDKIAGFGGPAASVGTGGGRGGRPNGGFGSTARIGTNVPTSSFNARPSPGSSSTLGGGDPDSVRKLKVPDVFKNATKPADVPVAAAAAAAVEVAPSAAPKKWATPAGSLKPGVSNGGGLGKSRAGSAPAGAPGWKARNGGACNNAAPDTTAKRPVSNAAKKPRDVFGLASAGSASSLARSPPAATAATAVESRPTVTGSRGGSGAGGGAESGRASPPSRSAKPKAGPRKLNLTRISAEKQRAALCLDKNLEEEDGSSGASNGKASPGGATTVGASKPAYGGSSTTTASNGGGRPASAAAASSSTTRPAPASRPAASGRAVGGGATRGGGNGIPSAGALRSSGHNLW